MAATASYVIKEVRYALWQITVPAELLGLAQQSPLMGATETENSLST